MRINDHGRVIGTGATRQPGEDSEYSGFVWDHESGLYDLGRGMWPKSINAAGLVAGTHLDNEDSWQTFLFEPSTAPRDVGLPEGWPRFTVASLNDAGQFAGTAEQGGDEEETSEAYLWDPGSGWTGFGRSSGVQDLNDAGQVLVNVGGMDEAVYDHRLFLWTPGTPARELGDGDYGMLNNLGQVAWGHYEEASGTEQVYLWDPQTETRTKVAVGRATGLNDQGQVAGVDDPWDIRAFVWSAQDGLTDLGTLPGADWSTALGINELGQVVGFSGPGAPGEPDWFHAFVWDQAEGMRDLGTFAEAENSAAGAINDAGQIVGWSSTQSDPWGGGMAVVWNPT
jgi:probable HAF family extracellular repeat protein